MPLDNRASSHLRKLTQITSRLCHEGQPLDSFTSDYRKIPYFNWNPPARDSLQASCKNDIDDQVKIDDFALVDSLTQNDIDHDLPNVDGNIQMTGDLMPDDGNIRVTGGLTLVDVNIQATGNSQNRDIDSLVLTDSHNDNGCSLTPDDENIRLVGSLEPDDGNIQGTGDSRVTGNLTPDDGNIQVGGDSQSCDNDVALVPLVQCDRQVHDNTQNNSGCGLLPDDGDIQVTGNNGVHIHHSIPKGIKKIPN